MALALASILFFQYSIEHGLITPAMRLALGSLLGGGCLFASWFLLGRGYPLVAHALAGAGCVALYAVCWAAHDRYDYVGMPTAFAGMVAVTIVACVLALRRRSALIAALALIGGFATPLLLHAHAGDPIGLFGYLLLLDGGLLFLARRGAWPALTVASLILTVAYQVFWIGTRMQPGELVLGLAILGSFALLFAGAARTLATRVGALLLPFAFAVHLALRADLGPHLWPIATLMLVLLSAAAWLGRKGGRPEPGALAAAAALGVAAVWLQRVPIDTAIAWEGALTLLAFALPLAVLRQAAAVLVACLGGLVVLLTAVVREGAGEPWPWWAGAVVLAATAFAFSGTKARALGQIAAAALLGATLALHRGTHGAAFGSSSELWIGALGLGVALVTLVAARWRGDPAVRQHALFAAILFAACVALGLPPDSSGGAARWLPIATAAAFIFWPIVAHRAFVAQRGAWRAAALTPLVFWPSLWWQVSEPWGA